MSERAFIERPRAFCALGGALQTVVALPKAVPILHSSMGCAASIYYNQYGSTGYLGAGYCGGMAAPSSNVGEMEIVFGGVPRLREQIENTLKIVAGDLYVVLSGCTPDMIGDDIQSVVRDFGDVAPIIGVETGGFRGDGYIGYDYVLQALIREYVKPQSRVDPHRVNLWGIVPGQDVFWRGNLSLLKAMLQSIGLEVNTFFSDGATLDDLRNAGAAALNVIVSPRYGLGAARVFERTHGTPFLSTHFPIGPSQSDRFLWAVGSAVGIDEQVIDKALSVHNRHYDFYIERLADAFNDLDLQRFAVIVGDANYAVALTRFVTEDLGWLPYLTVVTDDLAANDQETFREALSGLQSGIENNLVFETDASQIAVRFEALWPQANGQRHYNAFSPSFVLGSHLERQFAKNIGAAHLSVSYPIGNRIVTSRGYAGYAGALTLIEDMLTVIVAER